MKVILIDGGIRQTLLLVCALIRKFSYNRNVIRHLNLLLGLRLAKDACQHCVSSQ